MPLTETIFAVIIYSINTLLISYYLFSLIRNLIRSKHTQNLNEGRAARKRRKVFVWSGIICLICFWIRSFIAFIYFLVTIIKQQHVTHIGTTMGFAWTFYVLGLWIMLLSFLFRIDYSFRHLPFISYSPKLLYVLYISLIMVLIFFIITAIAGISIYTGNDSLVPTGEVTLYLAFISHFLFSLLFTWMLFRKVFVIMHQRLENQISVGSAKNNEELITMAGTNSNEEDDDRTPKRIVQQISLNDIKSSTRFALLIFTGIISTYIATVIVFVDLYLVISLSEHILTLSSCVIGIDLIVNATAIYLLFQSSTSKYYKCCGICHRSCEKCCVQCVYCTANRLSPDSNSIISSKQTKQDFANLILAPDDNDVIL